MSVFYYSYGTVQFCKKLALMIFVKKTNNLAQAFTVKQEEINEFMASQQKV